MRGAKAPVVRYAALDRPTPNNRNRFNRHSIPATTLTDSNAGRSFARYLHDLLYAAAPHAAELYFEFGNPS